MESKTDRPVLEARTYIKAATRRSYVIDEAETRTDVIDLLTDLLHFADARSIDFDNALRIARDHFQAEYDEADAEEERTARIAELNDLCRTAMGVAGRLVQTAGISALPPAVQSAIRERVETFNDFTPGNDPHRERDLGIFEHDGHRVMWKIDYYDRALKYGSEDPSDPRQTTRVLTIMLASEY